MASQPLTAKRVKPCRVVKLGGSLLNLPHLGERLQNWLDGEPEKMSLLVVGGGEFVETMRRLDAVHLFDATWCHWRCIELMQLTAQIMETQLPDWSSIRTPSELTNGIDGDSSSLRAIVYPAAYYTPELASLDGDRERLPETWETTSDSMAAYLARRIGAEELVLLKSISSDSSQVCKVT